jgi:hypothetical protein
VNRTGICGCCDGIDDATPLSIDNRPGLSRLDYRVGSWATFKASMLFELSRQPRLMRMRTRSDDDFSIALIDAFAMVCDILTFYSERGANEHYLRSAVDPVSTRELAKLVGYKPAPGVAASAALAFTLQPPPPVAVPAGGVVPTPSYVPSTLTVPLGTQAQSIPDPGEQAVTFETVAAIEARWNWNALRPRLSRRLADAAANATANHLRLRGLAVGIAVGDWMLLLPAGGNAGVQRVAAVTLDSASQTTLLRFDGAGGDPVLAADPGAGPVDLSGPLVDSAVASAVLARRWPDQAAFVAAAVKAGWPVQQLEDHINALAAAPPATAPIRVLRLGIRAALFGHNAVSYASLPRASTHGVKNWDHPPASVASDQNGSAPALSLDQVYPGLVVGGWLVVQAPGATLVRRIEAASALSRTGFMLSARVTQLRLDGSAAPLDALPVRGTTLLGASDEYVVADEPLADDIGGASIDLGSAQLGLKVGGQVVVTGAARDQGGRVASELRRITGVALVGGLTRLTLDRNLEHRYDPASVTLNANVALATHGQARSEILGSGDGAASYQRFVLKQPPLTWVSAATPSGIASTLEVRVNGVAWREVPWLAGQGAAERVYTTQVDENGNTVVLTGDGVENGARLPSGQANVTARYRSGLGSAGNLRAGQISTLLTRPQGVQAVMNPLPASGGGDPEAIDAARRNVPVTTRALDRIVTLEDVGDFARANAAVAKSRAVWAWNGFRQVACVTVAGPAGAAIDPDGRSFANLLAAMRAAGDGSFPIVLLAHVPRTFTVGATLVVDPALDADAVVEAARDALRNAFSFDARDFLQPVYRSEVYAVLQAVPGVVALTVDRFRYADAMSAPAPPPASVSVDRLVAEPPTLGAQGLMGAQLLTLEAGVLPHVVHA